MDFEEFFEAVEFVRSDITDYVFLLTSACLLHPLLSLLVDRASPNTLQTVTAIEPLQLTDAFFSTVPFRRLALAEDPDTEIIVLDTPPPDKPGGVPGVVDSAEVC